jgi:hypothetical protein
MLEKGAWEEDAPGVCTLRRHLLWEKVTPTGDLHLDSALSSTSMPHCRSIAATRVLLPMTKPTTLIAIGQGIAYSIFEQWG